MFQGINQIGAFLKCLMFLILVFFVWSTPAPVYAFDVTLQWDENPEADLAGYKVYYKTGTSGGEPYNGTGVIIDDFYVESTDSPIDVGNRTEVNLKGLDEEVIYYFVVTAYNTSGLESGYSNEENTGDKDDDGLPDDWEKAYGLDPFDSTGVNGWYGDFDGDGWANFEEYENESDPSDSTSVPSLSNILHNT